MSQDTRNKSPFPQFPHAIPAAPQQGADPLLQAAAADIRQQQAQAVQQEQDLLREAAMHQRTLQATQLMAQQAVQNQQKEEAKQEALLKQQQQDALLAASSQGFGSAGNAPTGTPMPQGNLGDYYKHKYAPGASNGSSNFTPHIQDAYFRRQNQDLQNWAEKTKADNIAKQLAEKEAKLAKEQAGIAAHSGERKVDPTVQGNIGNFAGQMIDGGVRTVAAMGNSLVSDRGKDVAINEAVMIRDPAIRESLNRYIAGTATIEDMAKLSQKRFHDENGFIADAGNKDSLLNRLSVRNLFDSNKEKGLEEDYSGAALSALDLFNRVTGSHKEISASEEKWGDVGFGSNIRVNELSDHLVNYAVNSPEFQRVAAKYDDNDFAGAFLEFMEESPEFASTVLKMAKDNPGAIADLVGESLPESGMHAIPGLGAVLGAVNVSGKTNQDTAARRLKNLEEGVGYDEEHYDREDSAISASLAGHSIDVVGDKIVMGLASKPFRRALKDSFDKAKNINKPKVSTKNVAPKEPKKPGVISKSWESPIAAPARLASNLATGAVVEGATGAIQTVTEGIAREEDVSAEDIFVGGALEAIAGGGTVAGGVAASPVVSPIRNKMAERKTTSLATAQKEAEIKADAAAVEKAVKTNNVKDLSPSLELRALTQINEKEDTTPEQRNNNLARIEELTAHVTSRKPIIERDLELYKNLDTLDSKAKETQENIEALESISNRTEKQEARLKDLQNYANKIAFAQSIAKDKKELRRVTQIAENNLENINTTLEGLKKATDTAVEKNAPTESDLQKAVKDLSPEKVEDGELDNLELEEDGSVVPATTSSTSTPETQLKTDSEVLAPEVGTSTNDDIKTSGEPKYELKTEEEIYRELKENDLGKRSDVALRARAKSIFNDPEKRGRYVKQVEPESSLQSNIDSLTSTTTTTTNLTEEDLTKQKTQEADKAATAVVRAMVDGSSEVTLSDVEAIIKNEGNNISKGLRTTLSKLVGLLARESDTKESGIDKVRKDLAIGKEDSKMIGVGSHLSNAVKNLSIGKVNAAKESLRKVSNLAASRQSKHNAINEAVKAKGTLKSVQEVHVHREKANNLDWHYTLVDKKGKVLKTNAPYLKKGGVFYKDSYNTSNTHTSLEIRDNVSDELIEAIADETEAAQTTKELLESFIQEYEATKEEREATRKAEAEAEIKRKIAEAKAKAEAEGKGKGKGNQGSSVSLATGQSYGKPGDKVTVRDITIPDTKEEVVIPEKGTYLPIINSSNLFLTSNGRVVRVDGVNLNGTQEEINAQVRAGLREHYNKSKDGTYPYVGHVSLGGIVYTEDVKASFDKSKSISKEDAEAVSVSDPRVALTVPNGSTGFRVFEFKDPNTRELVRGIIAKDTGRILDINTPELLAYIKDNIKFNNYGYADIVASNKAFTSLVLRKKDNNKFEYSLPILGTLNVDRNNNIQIGWNTSIKLSPFKDFYTNFINSNNSKDSFLAGADGANGSTVISVGGDLEASDAKINEALPQIITTIENLDTTVNSEPFEPIFKTVEAERRAEKEKAREEAKKALKKDSNAVTDTPEDIGKVTNEEMLNLNEEEVKDEGLVKNLFEGVLSVFRPNRRAKTKEEREHYRQHNHVANSLKQTSARPLVKFNKFLTRLLKGEIKPEDFLNADNVELFNRQKQAINRFANFAAEMGQGFKDSLLNADHEKSKYDYNAPDRELVRAYDNEGNPLPFYEFDENLLTAVSLGAITYISEKGGDLFFNSIDDRKKILGMDVNDSQAIPKELSDKLAQGITKNNIQNAIGKRIVQALGIKTTDPAYADTLPELTSALGAHGLNLLVKADYLDEKKVLAAEINAAMSPLEEGEDYKSSKNKFTNKDITLVYVRAVKEGDISTGINDKTAGLIDSFRGTESVLNKVFGIQSTESMPSLEPTNFVAKITLGAKQFIPKSLRETLDKKQKKPHKLDNTMFDVVDTLGKDFFLSLAGYSTPEDIAKLQATSRDNEATRSEGLAKDLDNALAFRGEISAKATADGKELYDTPFYYRFEVWQNFRVGFLGKVFNPQASKVHRFMAYSPEWEVDVDLNNKAQMREFYARVAEGFGYSFDKKYIDDNVNEFLGQYHEDDTIIDAVNALIEIRGGTVANMEASKAAIKRAVDMGGENIHTLHALQAMADMRMAQNAGQSTFKTRVLGTVDGVANGPILYHALHGIGIGNLSVSETLRLGGFIRSYDGGKNFVDYRSQPDAQDLYMQNIRDFADSLEAFYEQQEKILENPKSNEYAKKKATLALRLLPTVKESYGGLWEDVAVGEEIDANGNITTKYEPRVTSKGRNLGKEASPRLSFGSSTYSAIQAMASSYANQMIEKLADFKDPETGEIDAEGLKEHVELLALLVSASPAKGSYKYKSEFIALNNAFKNKSPEILYKRALEYEFTPKDFNNIKQSYSDSFGSAFSDHIDSHYKGMQEAGRTLTNMASVMFSLYKGIYDAKHTRMLREANAKYNEDKKEGEAPTTLHDLTVEQYAQLDNEMAAISPMIHTAFTKSVKGESTASGIRLTKSSVGSSPRKEYLVRVDVNTGEKIVSQAVQANYYSETGPGVQPISATTHSLDSFISHLFQDEAEVLNVHDAHISGMNNTADSARRLNEATFRAVVKRGPQLDMIDAFEKQIIAFGRIWNQEFAKGTTPDIAVVTNALLEDLKTLTGVNIDKAEVTTEDPAPMLLKLLEHAKGQAIQAELNKLSALADVSHVDQYASEGGAYELTEDDHKQVRDNLAKMVKMAEDFKSGFENTVSDAFKRNFIMLAYNKTKGTKSTDPELDTKGMSEEQIKEAKKARTNAAFKNVQEAANRWEDSIFRVLTAPKYQNPKTNIANQDAQKFHEKHPTITGLFSYIYSIDKSLYVAKQILGEAPVEDRLSPPFTAEEATNHSGGAIGSDSAWDTIGREFGVTNHRHYYHGKVTPKGNIAIDNQTYAEGAVEAARAAKRNFGYQFKAVKNALLIRNWAQVKNADAVFAIGQIVQTGEPLGSGRVATAPTVKGGTGYAVGMAILHNKPVYVFDQTKEQWFVYDPAVDNFNEMPEVPKLTKNFAGIGTRQINKAGEEAIKSVYSASFGMPKGGKGVTPPPPPPGGTGGVTPSGSSRGSIASAANPDLINELNNPNSNVKSVLNFLAKNIRESDTPHSKALSDIARRLYQLASKDNSLGIIPVKMLKRGEKSSALGQKEAGKNAIGWFYRDTAGNKIINILGPDFAGSKVSNELVLHEVLHAVLDEFIENNPNHPSVQALQELADIVNKVVNQKGSRYRDFREAGKNIHEVVSWGLTNPSFQKFLNDSGMPTTKSALLNKVSSLFDGFTTAIASMLGFNTKVFDRNGESTIDALSYLLSHVAVILDDINTSYDMGTTNPSPDFRLEGQAVTSKVSSMVDNSGDMNIDETNVNDIDIKGTFDALGSNNRSGSATNSKPFSDRLKGLLERIQEVTKVHTSEDGENAPTASKTATKNTRTKKERKAMSVGLRISDQEALAVESLEEFFNEALSTETSQRASLFRRDIEDLYKTVMQELKPEDLIPNGMDANDPYAQEIAQNVYNAIFNQGESQDASVNALARFMALGLGSEAFNKVLDKSFDSKKEPTDKRWSSRIRAVATRALNWSVSLATGIKDGQAANIKLDKLASNLTKIHRSHLQKASNKIYKADRTMDNMVGKAQVFTKSKIVSAIEAIDRKTEFVENLWGGNILRSPIVLASAMASGTEGRLVDEIVRRADKHFVGFHGVIAGTIKYMRGPKEIWQNMLIAGKQVQKAREAEVAAATQTALNIFDDNGLYIQEDPDLSTAITYTFMRSGAHHLLDAGYTTQDIRELLADDVAMNSAKDRAIRKLSKLPLSVRNYYINQARGLGIHTQRGGGNTNNPMQATNATQIARFYGVDKYMQDNYAKDYKKAMNKEALVNSEKAIAELITLYSLENSSYKTKAIEVMDRELARKDGGNGVDGLLNLLKNHYEESVKSEFKNSPGLMRHGYTSEITNSNVSIVVAPAAQQRQYELMDYEMLEYTLREDAIAEPLLRASTAPKDREMKMYVYRMGGMSAHTTGAMSYVDSEAKGATINAVASSVHQMGEKRSDIKDKAEAESILRAKMDRRMFTDSSFVTSTRGQDAIHAVPILNGPNAPMNYRYEMNAFTRDTIMERNNNFADIFGTMMGNLYEKPAARNQNKAVVDALIQDYKENFMKSPESYIRIGSDVDMSDQSIPNEVKAAIRKLHKNKSEEARAQEYWALLPESTRHYIKSKTGDNGIFVPKDAVDVLFGYRMISMGNVVGDYQNAVRDGTHITLGTKLFGSAINFMYKTYGTTFAGLSPKEAELFAKRAVKHIRTGEDLVANAVAEAKEIIVVKSGGVLLGNIISNQFQLMMNGINPIKAIAWQTEAYNLLEKWHKDNEELRELENRVVAKQTRGITLINARIDALRKAIAANPVTELEKKGMLPTLAEDLTDSSDPYSYRTKFLGKAEDKLKSMSDTGHTIGKQVYMGKGTASYRFLAEATQASDFVSKYALYKHLTTRSYNPLSDAEATKWAIDSFVYYDIPLPRGLAYMEKLGLLLFSKYLLSSQRILYKTFKKEPLHALSAITTSDWLWNLPTIMDSNMLEKIGRNPLEWSVLELPFAIPELLTLDIAEDIIF